MKIVDANILVYLIDEKSPHHERAQNWWKAALESGEVLGLSWIIVLAFLRLSTNPHVLSPPLSPSAACAQLDAWFAHPNVQVVSEGMNHWSVLKGLVCEVRAKGNLTTDSQLAALAITHNAVLVSTDADFGLFKGLQWERP